MSLSVISDSISIVIVGKFDVKLFSIKQLMEKELIHGNNIITAIEKGSFSEDKVQFNVDGIDVIIECRRIQVYSKQSYKASLVSNIARRLLTIPSYLECNAVGINFDIMVSFNKYSSYKQFVQSIAPSSVFSPLVTKPILNNITMVDNSYRIESDTIIRSISVSDQTKNTTAPVFLYSINVNNHKQISPEKLDDLFPYIESIGKMHSRFIMDFKVFSEQFK